MDNLKGHDTKEKFEGIKIEYLIIMEYGKSKLKRKELEDLLIDLNELSSQAIDLDLFNEIAALIDKVKKSIEEIKCKSCKNKGKDKSNDKIKELER